MKRQQGVTLLARLFCYCHDVSAFRDLLQSEHCFQFFLLRVGQAYAMFRSSTVSSASLALSLLINIETYMLVLFSSFPCLSRNTRHMLFLTDFWSSQRQERSGPPAVSFACFYLTENTACPYYK